MELFSSDQTFDNRKNVYFRAYARTGDDASNDGSLYIKKGIRRTIFGTRVENKNSGVIIVEDSRDGKSYKTAKIGNQIWMAENLAYEATGSCIYDDDDDNEAIYGRLYTWDAAMAGSPSSSVNPSNIQGICPTGWHLPSESEWNELRDYLIANGGNWDGTSSGNKIGKSLASTSGWYGRCHRHQDRLLFCEVFKGLSLRRLVDESISTLYTAISAIE